MYRYSRGQSGQGSLPRPAWGSSGAHGNRAASPEPGGLASAGGTNCATTGGDQPKERQDEVILQLENELSELRNALAWKDQRIAELSRTDTPAARLKRDIRQLATELHLTRKQLSESISEAQELSERLQRLETGRDSTDSPTSAAAGVGQQQVASGASGRDRTGSGADRGTQMREKISELTDENRQLRDTVSQLKSQAHSRQNNGMAGATGVSVEGFDGSHHGAHQPSGASTQRASEPPAGTPTNQGGYSGALGLRAPYLAGPPTVGGGAAGQNAGSGQVGNGASAVGSHPGTPAGVMSQTPGASAVTTQPTQQEDCRAILYSSANLEHAATVGPTMLQGVGTVDGVQSVAKVLLQRIHSSVCAAHRQNPGGTCRPHGPMVGMAPNL